jgi:thymidine phosphorylase
MAKKAKHMKLATYLIQNGYITVEQAQEVMQEQEAAGAKRKERFGRIAVKKGFISEKKLNHAVLEKEREEFSN